MLDLYSHIRTKAVGFFAFGRAVLYLILSFVFALYKPKNER
jgi:hypothetical protein